MRCDSWLAWCRSEDARIVLLCLIFASLTATPLLEIYYKINHTSFAPTNDELRHEHLNKT